MTESWCSLSVLSWSCRNVLGPSCGERYTAADGLAPRRSKSRVRGEKATPSKGVALVSAQAIESLLNGLVYSMD